MQQWIYFFGEGASEGDPQRKDILGGKGASLAAMSRAGLPVPAGFTISVEACRLYHESGGKWPDGLDQQVQQYVRRLEDTTGLKFGAGASPLLVSVRSGAARSMPGMMDTILNCGLHEGLAEHVPNTRRFWEVYAAFVKQFGKTVAEISDREFDEVAATLNGDGHRTLVARYMELYEQRAGRRFPRTPEAALHECIDAVFNSWNNERAAIYRQSHDIRGLEGTAVTVQTMYHSEVSGIAFTANPSSAEPQIIIESSYGLGESIVSGDVTPDRFVLDHDSGEVIEAQIGNKGHVMAGLEGHDQPVDPEAPSLSDAQLAEVTELALKVEDYFGFPVDIEWGLHRGKFALLQSRAIRGLEIVRDSQVGRLDEIRRLRERYPEGDKVWVMHNLAETLPAPTPLTWDVVKDFMSGDGGFGRLYRGLGYTPSDVVREEGFLELILGRIYADPDRAAGLFWGAMPFHYDHEEILADATVMERAPQKFDPARADGRFFLRVPGAIYAMLRSSRIMKRARANCLEHFEKQVLPGYLDYVRSRRQMDLTQLPTAKVVAEVRDRIERVMNEFGGESLLPGFFGGVARGEMEKTLIQLMGEQKGGDLTRQLTSGLKGDSTVEQNIMLYRVSQGKATLEQFLERFGHRAVKEMELAQPRWREDDSYLRKMIERYQSGRGSTDPEQLHHDNEKRREEIEARLPELLAEWGGSFLLEDLRETIAETQRLLPYREVGKHYLMMGYETIRLAILELSRRWDIGRDVFFLHVDELDQFEAQQERLSESISIRKTRWQSLQRLEASCIIDSRELDQLGLTQELEASDELKAVSLAPGVFVGKATLVFSPEEAGDLDGNCILVCPSTDPGWTALFPSIRGLIVERGGVLSHGAITARDFGIPAVACADATRLIAEGATIRVDGDRGQVSILESSAI
jgi:pyruvate,water dikinase